MQGQKRINFIWVFRICKIGYLQSPIFYLFQQDLIKYGYLFENWFALMIKFSSFLSLFRYGIFVIKSLIKNLQKISKFKPPPLHYPSLGYLFPPSYSTRPPGLNGCSVIMLIINSSTLPRQHMSGLPYYPEQENEQEKNMCNYLDSLSPTPSPQPTHHHLQFSLNISPSTENQTGTPASPLLKDGRRGRKSSVQLKNVNRGHWSTQENKKYHWFLQIHYTHFVNRHMRRMDKIFKTMELFIGTRQAEQCRSHHQKMEKKYLNFPTIIANLRRLHYNTLETEPMLAELEACGVVAFDGLASMAYLKEQQSMDTAVPEPKERKRSASLRAEREKQEQKEMREEGDGQPLDLPKIEEEKWDEGSSHQINMLQDENINIGQLSLIHEKEENSSIFHSIFL